MTVFFVLMFAGYCLFVLWLTWGWASTQVQELGEPLHSAVVIVPFRNEARHLERLLLALTGQRNLPGITVVLVNDHSSDDYRASVTPLLGENVRLLDLPDGQFGKKAAIEYAVRHTSAEIIVTTDADCLMGPLWLSSMMRLFSLPQVQLVAGPVRMNDDQSFFGGMQAIEFASLVGTTASFMERKRPVMCNGANLAYRRSAFELVGGFEGNSHVLSGDDEFLMRKVQSRWPGSVVFAKSTAAIVATNTQPSLESFLRQRLRWAGKWSLNSSWLAKATAVSMLLFHLAVLLLISSMLVGATPFQTGLALLAAKGFTEFLFIFPVATFLQIRWRWLPFLGLQWLHPAYVVAVGLWSQIADIQWKGRRQP